MPALPCQHAKIPTPMEQLRGQIVYPLVGGNSHANHNVMGETQNQGLQQRYFVVVPTPVQQVNDGYANYRREASCVLGALQITVALVLIGLNAGGATVNLPSAWLMSTGFWAAPIYIVAGSFGIAAGRRPNNCTVNTTMVMSVISCVTVIPVATQFALNLISPINRTETGSNVETSHIVLTSLFLVFGICEYFFALAQSILCCQVCCCGRPVQPSQAVHFQNGGYGTRYTQGSTETPQNEATEPFGTYLTPIGGATGPVSSTLIPAGGAANGTPNLETTDGTYDDVYDRNHTYIRLIE